MNYTYNDTPVGFHRLNKMPLDDREIFSSTEDLFNYIKSGASYEGQRLVLKYNKYCQEIILKKIDGNTLVPIMKFPNGFEVINKEYNNHQFILVSYYNKGSYYTDRSQNIRFNDSFAYSFLPQANLIANSVDYITYMLEIDDNRPIIFRQKNFVLESIPLEIDDNINGVSSATGENGFYITNDSTVVILPTKRISHIIRLWVQCDDYYKALEGNTNG